MKRVHELSLAAFGSALWWLIEHLLDKGIGHLMLHFLSPPIL